MRARWLLVCCLALTLAGCGLSSTDVPPPAGPAQSGAPVTATVQAIVGTVQSTLVLDAAVRASAPVTVTARAAGRYALDAGRLIRVTDDGRRTTVPTPPGVVLDELSVSDTASVPVNHPVAVGHTAGFALVAEVPAASLYRLYAAPQGARGQINEGPGPFECVLVDPVPQIVDSTVTLTCAIPDTTAVYAGMSAILSVRTGSAKDVVLLPLEAIAGDAASGTVLVLRPGEQPEEREVGLGVSDGSRIAVVSGLRAGETVRIPGPDLGGRS